ncbi:PREDICTED: heterochromatin protein 1-like [Nicrophorus vespilloides]|uniref:Heterochromatin protein 1-like n=1 Tax=Nicrophorus vespilloides TaxID=110193 RepID=A0ABM1N1R4_NICVS|nr:PREDICTED: heterochromatin protein 1-like [Nicrophorus vespilloides]
MTLGTHLLQRKPNLPPSHIARIQNGVVEYFLKWSNYWDSEYTWEHESNIYEPELIGEFEAELLKKKENEKIMKRKSAADVYAVEKILDKRIQNGVVEYFLKWSGYGDSENTWELRSNLYDPELIREFEAKWLKKEKEENIKK